MTTLTSVSIYWYLVFGMSFPLSAEAVIKFGPIHILFTGTWNSKI